MQPVLKEGFIGISNDEWYIEGTDIVLRNDLKLEVLDEKTNTWNKGVVDWSHEHSGYYIYLYELDKDLELRGDLTARVWISE